MSLYPEYGNQNEGRQYPFQDGATLVAANGVTLSSNAIIDIFLYTTQAVTGVYLRQVLGDESTFIFANSDDDTDIGYAVYESQTSAVIYDFSESQRPIGTIVFGSGISTYIGLSDPLEFTSVTAPLVPSAFIGLVQNGVRSLATEGGAVFNGHVNISGVNGVNVKTYIDGDRNLLRVDIVGKPKEPLNDCDACPPIKFLKIINEACSRLIGSNPEDGIIAITGYDFQLADLCDEKKIPDQNGVLPNKKYSPCNSYTPPEEWQCHDASEFTISPLDGIIRIIAPATLASDNPVKIINNKTPGESITSNLPTDPQTLEDINKRMSDITKYGTKDRCCINIGLKQ